MGDLTSDHAELSLSAEEVELLRLLVTVPLTLTTRTGVSPL
jgi:hypothetical protein